MSKLPTSSRAMRRAAAAKARKGGQMSKTELHALEVIAAAKARGMTVDGTEITMPAVEGKVAWSVEMPNGASLDWNLTWAEADQFIAQAEQALPPDGDRRAVARQIVVDSLLGGRHLKGGAHSTLVAALVVWLALTSPQAPQLRNAGPTFISYAVTHLGGEDWNFRLIAGRT